MHAQSSRALSRVLPLVVSVALLGCGLKTGEPSATVATGASDETAPEVESSSREQYGGRTPVIDPADEASADAPRTVTTTATGGRSDPAPTISGKVIRVTDGDTLTILDDENSQTIIRLNGIDAPEKAQAFGDKARQALRDRVAGKQVSVETYGADRYGRTIGTVFLAGESMNAWLIRNGWAWHYKKYSDDRHLADAEDVARANGIGLWAAPGPVPPWEFRNPPTDPHDDRLYVQGNGKRYHRANCTTLDARRRVIDVDEARRKYTPCRVCKPPTVEESAPTTQ